MSTLNLCCGERCSKIIITCDLADKNNTLIDIALMFGMGPSALTAVCIYFIFNFQKWLVAATTSYTFENTGKHFDTMINNSFT